MSDRALPMRLVVVGAAGRMGQALIRNVLAMDGVALAAAIERDGADAIGQDAGVLAGVKPAGVTITGDPLVAFAAADGVLDFTVPAASVAFAGLAAQARIAHVIGTTGFSEADLAAIGAAARHACIVRSGNFSLGVNVLQMLVKHAAAVLGPEYDIEIVEMHHRRKVDAPSGTALLLGEAAAAGRDIALAIHAIRSRDGHTGPRPVGPIGFATLRGGTVVGEHSVILAGEGERIELTHRAESRDNFAVGAIRAALWAHGRKPGLFSMADVLGLTG
jgi:4-hydroxy-tetrahydrodipicolinate reductase